jgi:hypothetical protein
MESLCAWLIAGGIAWAMYRHGKRLGSRKGYHAGRRRRRR